MATVVVAVAVVMILPLVLVAQLGRARREAERAEQLEIERRTLVAERRQVRELARRMEALETLASRVREWTGLHAQESQAALDEAAAAAAASEATALAAAEAGPSWEEGAALRHYADLVLWEERLGEARPSSWPVEGWLSRRYTSSAEEPGGHHGIDISAARGTDVLAPAAGVVATAGWDSLYGNVVLVDHGFGFVTLYGHNDDVVVDEGDAVERGQVIAHVGNSGQSTAPHLHFEVQRHGLPVDPLLYLPRVDHPRLSGGG
jgi:murein DD-endopeptidase MepM/ murein hydrolase activator NlpD